MVIICGESAWAWHRTPPAVRALELTGELADRARVREPYLIDALRPTRAIDREFRELLGRRLLGELKGIPLPIHVATDISGPSRASVLMHPHRLSRPLPTRELIPLGNGLFVTSPRLTLLQLAWTHNLYELVMNLFEACGLYAIFDPTPRARIALSELERAGYLERSGTALAAYLDENGKPEPMLDYAGTPLSWEPCIDRFGHPAGFWKRPPLVTVEELHSFAAEINKMHGVKRFRQAVELVLPGSGSPLESKLLPFLTFPSHLGGEGWEAPDLNRRVAFNQAARRISGMSGCVCDELFEQERLDLEVQGEAFHVNEQGFARVTGRRAGLEAMGYTMMEVTYAHMNDLESLETIIDSLARKLERPLCDRANTFLAARHLLHEHLFPRGRH